MSTPSIRSLAKLCKISASGLSHNLLRQLKNDPNRTHFEALLEYFKKRDPHNVKSHRHNQGYTGITELKIKESKLRSLGFHEYWFPRESYLQKHYLHITHFKVYSSKERTVLIVYRRDSIMRMISKNPTEPWTSIYANPPQAFVTMELEQVPPEIEKKLGKLDNYPDFNQAFYLTLRSFKDKALPYNRELH